MTGRDDSGATLVDLIVALAFGATVGLLTSTWAQAVIGDSRRQQGATELSESVAIALDIIAAETRNAGFNPSGLATTGIIVASRERFEIQSDLDGDGDSADSHERIVYSYRASNRQLTRASGQGGGQLLVDKVAGFALTYFDAGGAELSPATSGLTDAQRAVLRSVDVRLRAEALVRGELLAAQASTTIRLRNRPTGGAFE